MTRAPSLSRVIATFVAVLAILVFTDRPALAASQANVYGAVSAMNAFSLSKLPASQWDPQLAAMSANGVQLIRSDADWGTIEPDAPGAAGPVWQFGSTDAWVAALATHGLTWQPILDYDNSWATAVGDHADFAAFAQAVVKRYGVGGTFWAQHPELPAKPVQIVELWNEENGQPWFISPEDYGPLYAATRAAIHAVDDQVSVDVGGLSDDSGDFSPNRDYPAWYVIRMLGADPALVGNIDGFALHPYGTTATDDAEWVIHFRAVLNQLHEGSVPIDITEFGWVTGSTASNEDWRTAQMNALGTAFARSDCGLRELAPYDWVNPTVLAEPGDFGFVDAGAQTTSLRPAASAWFAAFARAGELPRFAMCAPTPPAQTTAATSTGQASVPAPAADQASVALPAGARVSEPVRVIARPASAPLRAAARTSRRSRSAARRSRRHSARRHSAHRAPRRARRTR